MPIAKLKNNKVYKQMRKKTRIYFEAKKNGNDSGWYARSAVHAALKVKLLMSKTTETRK